MRYYIFYAKYTAILELISLTTYLQIIFFEHAVIVPFSVHLRVPRLPFSPARRESFRTQHQFYSIPKPPNSSSCLSFISFTDLLRLRSPGLPLLSSSVWFSATVLGEMLCNALTSWRDVNHR